MDYLPLFTRLENRRCVVVGGGAIALRKAGLLARARAKIFVVAPQIDPQLQLLAQRSGGSAELREYQSDDLDATTLVIAATDDAQVNAQVSHDAQARHVLVNVVDNPALCSVILPSIIDRSPLMIAIGSGGQSPVLARQLRAKLESVIPAAYGRLAQLVGRFRERAAQRFPDIDMRRRFWEEVLEGPIAEFVLAGREDVAESELSRRLADLTPPLSGGEVYLVGAGPGDPDLLTFKALRLMQKAEVVLYDRLVAPEIVDLTRRDAERIYVGKARADHALPQRNINELLVDLAKQGKKVLRLKGGDPFIFGRGGEEIEKLAEHKIPFQVVPGITAASGCAAYAGIPLTHRDYAQSVRFVTGHLKNNTTDLPWAELVHANQTVVFYMGLIGLNEICTQLIAHGRAASTPIALIQQGTSRHQRVIIGTLADMPVRVVDAGVKAPTLIIVGEVVQLQEKLAWFTPAADA
ncbi:MAG TPA: siroheme synthase CysG [Spongiibacteraceae bacterium]|jgi:uroporphyrin-III C-methyltransferase/precorrin-2 dehydrogenase/sirohydrochlorin ferrochelatase